MEVFQGKIARNVFDLSQMETKMGPDVQYFCWVLLSSPGVNSSLSTIFLGHPVCLSVGGAANKLQYGADPIQLLLAPWMIIILFTKRYSSASSYPHQLQSCLP